MKYPYLISSDQHAHSWSAFSGTTKEGVNSRLQIILDELQRSAAMLRKHEGTTMILAGDLFHVRGEIKPSVFNPTVAMFRDMLDPMIVNPIEVHAVPGNHDLEGKDAHELGNAMQALGSIPNFNVHTKVKHVGDVVVVPWYQDLGELRDILGTLAKSPKASGLDVIIHAPVNGVIKGIPSHGLEASELAAFGFRRVFAGHYHDHQVFEGGKVISVGATTHQTWSDPGTKAGFLLVWEDRIEHVESLAPKFVDLDVNVDPNDIDILVKGNYVRLKLDDVTDKEIKEWREELTDSGALGVVVIATKKATTGRSGASTKAAISVDASVIHYIDNDMKPMLRDEVSELALECLNEARS